MKLSALASLIFMISIVTAGICFAVLLSCPPCGPCPQGDIAGPIFEIAGIGALISLPVLVISLIVDAVRGWSKKTDKNQKV